jgi:hypothetical protein
MYLEPPKFFLENPDFPENFTGFSHFYSFSRKPLRILTRAGEKTLFLKVCVQGCKKSEILCVQNFTFFAKGHKGVFVKYLVFLLGIFRRAPRPSDTRGALVPFSFPGGALPLKQIFFFFFF